MKSVVLLPQLLMLASIEPCVLSSSTSSPPTYRDSLVSLHKSLVDIPSISNDEAGVGEFLVNYLMDNGFTTERQPMPSEEERFNVIAWPKLRQSNSPKVMLTSHMDVVPPYIPYSRSGPDPPTAETVIAGRGTVDAKAGIAAQITAAVELLAQDAVSADDMMLLFVVGEEIGGDGMQHYSNLSATQPGLRPQAAIFAEPTEGKLACGHKGSLTCTVTGHGKSAHSGYPWLGKNAIEALMRALVRVVDADLGSSEVFGNTTTNVGLIEGGVAANVVPDLATASLVLRVAIGPELEGATVVKNRLVDILTSADPSDFEVECNTGYGAIESNCDVQGFEVATMNYGTDIPNFKGNHTRYLYGPGSISVAHRPDEALTVGELETAVEGYKKLILHAVQV